MIPPHLKSIATLPREYQHLKTENGITQGRAATHVRWGGIFNDYSIENLLLSV